MKRLLKWLGFDRDSRNKRSDKLVSELVRDDKGRWLIPQPESDSTCKCGGKSGGCHCAPKTETKKATVKVEEKPVAKKPAPAKKPTTSSKPAPKPATKKPAPKKK